MAILQVLFRRATSRRLRLMAAANVFACTFVTVMTMLTSFVGYFIIVPVIFKDDARSALFHRFLIGYLFVNVCGNFILCVCTDTSTARSVRRTTTRHKGKAPSMSALRKANALKTNSSLPCSSESVLAERSVKESEGESRQKSSRLMFSFLTSIIRGKNVAKLQQTTTARSQVSAKFHNPEDVKSDVNHDTSVGGENASTSDVNNGASGHKENASANSNDFLDPVFTVKGSEGKSSSNVQTARRVSTTSRNTTDTQRSCADAGGKSSVTKQPGETLPTAPERSHWCRLCEKRILRRDHHCFFMTVCIGYHNHKHFIFFCLYMMLGALYGVVLAVRFLHVVYQVRFWGPHTFLLLLLHVAGGVWVRGVLPPPLFLLHLYLMYVCLAVGLVAAGFLYWHLAITLNGQTTHEATRGDLRYRRQLTHNLGDVLGRYWPLLLLLPLPLPQAGHGRSYVAASTTTTKTNNATSPSTATKSASTTSARGGNRDGGASPAEKGNAATKGSNYGDVDRATGENCRSERTAATATQDSHVAATDAATAHVLEKGEGGGAGGDGRVRERRRGGGGVCGGSRVGGKGRGRKS
ncbi:uncharacterized protein LOC143295971 [Babylonia areolata]|uniref:uncharacterized protein LOC143295971 n=1 Tax=Babylonia areolata TaxID=304850 RepID=UPI003FD01E2F